MAVVMVFSVIMAVAIFMVLPLFLASIFHRFIASQTVMAVIEGNHQNRNFYRLYQDYFQYGGYTQDIYVPRSGT